ncbi:MAG: indolepyruvate oxidoreductase subunit beta [Anaerolineae bacterium]
MTQENSETNGSTNFLLAGVGGQGILLAADVVARVGLAQGYDVKKSEIHGMAQRGGSVTSHVRWGRQVWSPTITPGEADYVLAFERLEALRYLAMLRSGGTLLVSDYRIAPVTVSSGDDRYPTPEDEARMYAEAHIQPTYVPAIAIAEGLGQTRVNNVVMLGALSATLDLPEAVWLDTIAERVPERFVELNRRAFMAGRDFVLAREPGR